MKKYMNTLSRVTVGATASVFALGMALAARAMAASVQVKKATIAANKQAHSHVTGNAQYTFNPSAHTLTVVVHAGGFAPKSAHREHIHSGNRILFNLKNLVADTKGNASATTVLHNVNSVPSNAQIMVHDGVNRVRYGVIVASGTFK